MKATILPLRIVLSVTNPRRHDSYTLVVYSDTVDNAPSADWPRYRDEFRDVKLGRAIDAECVLHTGEHSDSLPRHLTFELYALSSITDVNRLWSETMLGFGRLKLQPLLTLGGPGPATVIPLCCVDAEDTKNAVEARLRISVTSQIQSDLVADDHHAAAQIASAVSTGLDDEENRFPKFDPREEQTLHSDIIPHIDVAYTYFSFDPELQVFKYLDTTLGQMPLMFVPLLATCPLNNHKEHILRFLLHLTRLSCAVLDEPVELAADDDDGDEWLHNMDEASRLAAILVQMVLWLPRCILYVADSEPSTVPGSRKTVPTDVFSPLLTFPRPGWAGADCEDFAGLSLVMLEQIRNVSEWWPNRPMAAARWTRAEKKYDPALPLLHSISRLLHQYTPFYLATQVWENKDKQGRDVWSGHAVCALLDRRAVCDRMLGHNQRGPLRDAEQYYPGLLIDGVGHSSGVWSEAWMREERTNRLLQRRLQHGEKVLTEQVDEARARRILKNYVPAQAMCDRNMYGPVAQLITARYHKPDEDSTYVDKDFRGLHVVPHAIDSEEGQGKPAMGISMQDLLTYNFTSEHMYINQHFTESTLSYLRACMADMPVSALPSNPCPLNASVQTCNELRQLHASMNEQNRKKSAASILTARAFDVELAGDQHEHENENEDEHDNTFLYRIAKARVHVQLCDDMACVELLV